MKFIDDIDSPNAGAVLNRLHYFFENSWFADRKMVFRQTARYKQYHPWVFDFTPYREDISDFYIPKSPKYR